MSRRSTLRILALAVLAACLALAPVSAFAKTAPAATRLGLKLAPEQVRKMRPGTLHALELPGETVIGHINGRVGHSAGWWQDASLWAEVYMDDGSGSWWWVNDAPVNADGTYSVEIYTPGEYRVGFSDYAWVYEPIYYQNALSVDDATTVPVSQDETVTSIDVTVTPLPENMISGTVSFVGAPAPSGDVESYDFVEVTGDQYQDFGEDGGWWEPMAYGRVNADGTYRLHLPQAGSYRVGFHDLTGRFEEVYYKDAPSAEVATDVPVPSPAESKTGIDQTLTALPSERVSGDDRYGTAAAISQFGFPEDVRTVVLATGENWPDAIAGSAMAANDFGPLLLTKKGYLPQATRDELERLMPFQVVIIGSPDAVSLDVEIALRTEFNIPLVWRLSGRDRYETAMLVAEQMSKREDGPMGVAESTPATPPIVVASGEKYPDAMCAAPLAAQGGSPVLLVKRDSVPASVQGFLDRHADQYEGALVIGGTSTIASSTADVFGPYERIAGNNRYETAAKVAQYGVDTYGTNAETVGIASGQVYADGLASVPVMAAQGHPLLFTTPLELSPATEAFMLENGTTRAIVFGGEPSVSADTYDQILEVLGSGGIL